jgi:hypothetical protein
MVLIEQRIRKIVEATGEDKQGLIRAFVREVEILHAALPSPADLEAIAYQLETGCRQEVELPDGTTFDASMLLRRSAELIRLALNEKLAPEPG